MRRVDCINVDLVWSVGCCNVDTQYTLEKAVTARVKTRRYKLQRKIEHLHLHRV